MYSKLVQCPLDFGLMYVVKMFYPIELCVLRMIVGLLCPLRMLVKLNHVFCNFLLDFCVF